MSDSNECRARHGKRYFHCVGLELLPAIYDRQAAMAWLSDRYSWSGFTGPDFNDASPSGRAALIAWLEGRCRAMRAAGVSGRAHYDLPAHAEHKRILEAERAALAVATQDRPPVIRQRLRAA
jgi:hypothetical protein